jgi:hypothetical protein
LPGGDHDAGEQQKKGQKEDAAEFDALDQRMVGFWRETTMEGGGAGGLTCRTDVKGAES